MRWRVSGINGETRKIARQAAQAAGLPLAAWLDRAILQASPAQPIVAEAEPDLLIHEPVPLAVEPEQSRLADPEPSRPSEPEQPIPTADTRENRIANLIAAPPTATPSSNRRLAVIGALVMVIAAIALGAVWLRPAPPVEPASQQTAARNPSSPATRAEPEAEQTLPEIIAQLQRDASAGDAKAQHDLALAYINGQGVPQNYQTAAELLEQAAIAGLERAQYNLAVLFEHALGVPQDLQRAFALYRAAADQGFGPAQHNVGVAYAQGNGVKQDYQAATLWFRRAAEQGIASAQFNLGMIYEKGLAGPPDEKTAYGWYRLAAAAGSEVAVARLAAIEGRIAAAEAKPRGKPVKLTRAEIAEVQRLLGQLAFEPGPADGKIGQGTRAAIRRYQQIADLPVTGEATMDLLVHLRQVTAMMAGTSN